jgi:hypothetical protein
MAGPAHSATDWRRSIQAVCQEQWPGLDPDWIESQVQAESAGNPKAISPCGAEGLLQLMPLTALEVGCADTFDPEQNLRGGVKYLRRQYESLSRIPDETDRLLWSFAAYNGGRGYVSRALALAEFDGERPWSTWEPNWRYLFHPDCEVKGKRPDFRQIRHYVSRIQAHYRRLKGQA